MSFVDSFANLKTMPKLLQYTLHPEWATILADWAMTDSFAEATQHLSIAESNAFAAMLCTGVITIDVKEPYSERQK